MIKTVVAIVASFILVATLHKPGQSKPSSLLLIPPENLKNFTFGYNEIMADSLWLRVVQDFDRCGRVEVDDRRDFKNGYEAVNCEQSWPGVMLRSVTELAPKFKAPYSFGAVALSIMVNDKAGAAELFERGVKQYPEDWSIAYRAGYHYFFEMNQPDRAASFLMQAAKHGAPEWVYAFAGRMYDKAGQRALGISVLEDALSHLDPESNAGRRVRLRLDEMKSGKAL